jgi:hypothetical protein
VKGQRRQGTQNQEEEVLNHDGLLCELAQIASAWNQSRHGLFLDARPSQVDIKQEQKNAQTKYGWLMPY